MNARLAELPFLAAAMLAAVLAMPRQVAAQCDSGSVTDNAADGTVTVVYTPEDPSGSPSVRTVTMIRPTRVVATITETVTRDTSAQVFTYRYTVTNDAASEQQVGTVELAIPKHVPVQGFGHEASGPGWMFFPESNPDGGFSWAFMVGTERADLSVEGIPPGGQASFWFSSPWAPGRIKAYLRGVEPDVSFPGLPGCLEDAIIDITGFPRDYVAFAVRGPAIAP